MRQSITGLTLVRRLAGHIEAQRAQSLDRLIVLRHALLLTCVLARLRGRLAPLVRFCILPIGRASGHW